eukprot:3364933-Amphidinium_carterae.1
MQADQVDRFALLLHTIPGHTQKAMPQMQSPSLAGEVPVVLGAHSSHFFGRGRLIRLMAMSLSVLLQTT